MKIGDKVSVIDEDLEGTLVSVKDKTAVFEDSHGFRHEYPLAQLVLRENLIYDEVPLTKKEETKKNISQKHQKNAMKIDLHFDQLVKNPHEYDSWERLFIQKERLIEVLDFCKANKIKRLEVVHGLGEGVLQELVYDVLRGYAGIEFEENEFFKHQSASVEVIFVT